MVFEAMGREYVLGGRVGDGAVGVVRRAKDRETDRVVAVKFLAPDTKYIEPAAIDEVAERFKREGKRGVGLRHEHLVEVLAYEDNAEGKAFRTPSVKNPFLIMEYVRGRTVEALIRKLGRPADGGGHITAQTLTIATAITNALQHLHERRIVHRDVKPANIYLSTATPRSVPSDVRLGDFGVTKWGDFLARATTGSLTVTMQRGLGTLKYMSPEQAIRPKDVTVRSDMYSLGITLFELFTGEIMPSPHHVFEIRSARTMRGALSGKLLELGLRRLTPFDEAVLEPVLDMFSAPKGRPTSKEMSGRFLFFLERLTGESAT